MTRFVIPFGLFASVLLGGLILTLVVTLRPWAGADASYHTHLNLYEVPPEDYTRTEFSAVGDEVAAPQGWLVSSKGQGSTGLQKALELYVGRACASCHGVEGEGTASGPQVLGVSERKLTKVMRDGSGGMPPYSEQEVTQEDLSLKAYYIESLGPAPEETPTPTPRATPWPSATPIPSPTATRTPVPTYTPTAVPPGEGDAPSPTPAPTETPTPTATATAVPTAIPKPEMTEQEFNEARQLYIDVGCDVCHGTDGLGNEKGPNVIGYTPDETWKSVREGIRDPDSKYAREMKPADATEITDEELQQIIDFMLNLEE